METGAALGAALGGVAGFTAGEIFFGEKFFKGGGDHVVAGPYDCFRVPD